MTPGAEATSVNGILRFSAILPLPPWDKNSRLVPNCIRRESKEEGGRLYYKPGAGLWKLSPAANVYRAMVAALVRPVLPRKPFFVKGLRWVLNFEQHGPGDVDHYLAGILDDVIYAGLATTDRDCKRRVVDVYDEDNVMQTFVTFNAWQDIR